MTEIVTINQNTKLSHNIRALIEKTIMNYHDVSSLSGDPLPWTESSPHKILLKDQKTINMSQYRHLEYHKEEIWKQVDKMLTKTVIPDSNSLHNAPLWIVPKIRNASGVVK